MISKNQQKYISSLELKKNRKKDNVFVAEGFKIVNELLQAGYRAKMIVACEEWMSQHLTPITHHPSPIYSSHCSGRCSFTERTSALASLRCSM